MAMSITGRLCRLWRLGRTFSSSEAPAVVLAASFEDPKVQQCLREITGLDFNRVFASRKQNLSLPVYNLLTEEQLEEVHSETSERAQELLEMASVLPEREERGQDIQVDPRLEGFDDHKWVFVDISMGKEDKDRYIMVRDTTGTLREGTWEERDRLCQTYMPQPGRKQWLPTLLSPTHLPGVLSKGRHLHALELACVQCQPDSKDFIRVHHTVYNDIHDKSLYQCLHSTKHFGGLVWHLLNTRCCLEGLLKSFMEHKQFKEAESLVNLYILCWPDSSFVSSLPEATPTELELIKLFCNHHGYDNVQEMVDSILEQSQQTVTS